MFIRDILNAFISTQEKEYNIVCMKGYGNH